MRDPRTIELEIDVARQDLQANLSELKDAVLEKLNVEKLNVKKRAKEAVEERTQRVKDLVWRGADRVVALGQRGKQNLFGAVKRLQIGAREQPQLAIVAVGALLVAGLLIVRHSLRANR